MTTSNKRKKRTTNVYTVIIQDFRASYMFIERLCTNQQDKETLKKRALVQLFQESNLNS